MPSLPLAIDLDGTLIEGDSTVMSVLGLLRRSPLIALVLLPMFLWNRARFKDEVAKRYVPDVMTFNFVPEVVAFAREQKSLGRTVILATASHEKIAHSVAEHLGCFDGVIASDREHYRGGKGKADALTERFGPKGFAYAGNEARDLPVWEAAAAAILVRVPAPVVAIAKKRFTIEREFP